MSVGQWVETTYLRNPTESDAREVQGFMPATLLGDGEWRAVITDMVEGRRKAEGIVDVVMMRFNDDEQAGLAFDLYQFAPLGTGDMQRRWKVACPPPGEG